MTTLADVVGATKTALDTIPGLYVYDYWPGVPNLDACIILPAEIDYRQAMKAGVIHFNLELRLLVGISAGHEQQKTLWPYLEWATDEPRSLLQVLGADRTLGLTDVSTAVMSSRPLGFEEIPPLEGGAFGAAVTFQVAVTNRE